MRTILTLIAITFTTTLTFAQVVDQGTDYRITDKNGKTTDLNIKKKVDFKQIGNTAYGGANRANAANTGVVLNTEADMAQGAAARVAIEASLKNNLNNAYMLYQVQPSIEGAFEVNRLYKKMKFFNFNTVGVLDGLSVEHKVAVLKFKKLKKYLKANK